MDGTTAIPQNYTASSPPASARRRDLRQIPLQFFRMVFIIPPSVWMDGADWIDYM